MTTTNDGTIDITNLVSTMQSSFVLAAEKFIMASALAVPGIGPVAVWCLNAFGSTVINWVLNKLSTWTIMEAFFVNTAVRKASQAADYQNAVNVKNNLPDTVSDADYAKAEQDEIDHFTNFVKFTN